MDYLIYIVCGAFIIYLMARVMNIVDSEYNIKPSKKEILILGVVYIIAASTVLYSITGSMNDSISIIIVAILIYLGYMDLKIKQIYITIPIIIIIMCGAILLISGRVAEIQETNFIAIIVFLIYLLVVSVTKVMGLGDTIVLLGMLMYYIILDDRFINMILMTTVLSHIFMLIFNLKHVIKNIKISIALIPYIAIANVMTIIYIKVQ